MYCHECGEVCSEHEDECPNCCFMFYGYDDDDDWIVDLEDNLTVDQFMARNMLGE